MGGGLPGLGRRERAGAGQPGLRPVYLLKQHRARPPRGQARGSSRMGLDAASLQQPTHVAGGALGWASVRGNDGLRWGVAGGPGTRVRPRRRSVPGRRPPPPSALLRPALNLPLFCFRAFHSSRQ
ncbi:unnamed protein product [Rangifer tarandus platyrhynchus]|uniref:Uncharacterized protein n=1 Tax=Rangifer tarandus platyrhynchus TaxID=3082113 RepID=A0AC59ZLG4_RANTA